MRQLLWPNGTSTIRVTRVPKTLVPASVCGTQAGRIMVCWRGARRRGSGSTWARREVASDLMSARGRERSSNRPAGIKPYFETT